MKVAAILIALLAVTGALLYLHHRLTEKPDGTASPDANDTAPQDSDQQCCGMHITCEKDSLINGLDREIVYYDDEELDAYRGRDANDYTDREIDEFRDVLLTLRPDDIAGWARSISARGLQLPAAVRDELLMIVAEARNNKTTAP